jgi:ubiquinone/menaquinone biosynthesis C-methylase UbiE
LAGYAWEGLPEGSLVVDVGGGVGSQSLTLATHHPHLRFVVQDRELVVGDATEVCAFTPLASARIVYA